MNYLNLNYYNFNIIYHMLFKLTLPKFHVIDNDQRNNHLMVDMENNHL